MNTLPSSRSAKRIPQLALRFGALPDGAVSWCDGCGIVYLGREITVRLSTHQGGAELDGDELHLPLPPEASGRQVQDSAEAWLRQQCLTYVDEVLGQLQSRQLVLVARRYPQILLSFAARSPWVAVEDANTLRCNWRLIEQTPQVLLQHAEKALREIDALQNANATADMFGATFN